MTMVHCRNCGEMIHESALACPKCGSPQGTASALEEIPDGVKGWSWGAFLFNWLWGVCNGTWIALLTLVPFVGWIMMFVLGVKGREWAWKNKKWDSLEHFQRVQRLWSIWAVWLTLVPLVIGILAAIAIPAYQGYVERSRHAAARVASEPVRPAAAAASVVVPPPAPAPQERAPEPVAEIEPPVNTQREVAAAAPASAAVGGQDLLVARAQSCAGPLNCVQVMLDGAHPRRADVLNLAAARLVETEALPAGDKKSSRALNTQGLARYAENDFAGAVDLFAQAASINPRDSEIQSNFGLALIRAGKPQEAVGALTNALQIDPRRSTAWAPLAEAMDKLGRPNYTHAALLLVYEFSGNRQKTIDFFHARSETLDVPESMRAAYASAAKVVETGY